MDNTLLTISKVDYDGKNTLLAQAPLSFMLPDERFPPLAGSASLQTVSDRVEPILVFRFMRGSVVILPGEKLIIEVSKP